MKTKGNQRRSQTGMRKPVVNPAEQRKRFLALAEQLRNGTPLSTEQLEFLVSRFESIGQGESADVAFHLKRRPGQKIEDEEHRRTMSLVFAQIAHYVAPPDSYPPGEGLPLNGASKRSYLSQEHSLATKTRRSTPMST